MKHLTIVAAALMLSVSGAAFAGGVGEDTAQADDCKKQNPNDSDACPPGAVIPGGAGAGAAAGGALGGLTGGAIAAGVVGLAVIGAALGGSGGHSGSH